MRAEVGSFIRIAESARDDLITAASAAHPYETGGILLGVTAQTEPWVTRMVELETRDRGRSHYRLPAGRTRAAVKAAREEEPRLGYLGDWHAHPADVGPSTTDRATMLRLAHRRMPVRPILIVVRRTVRGYELDVHQVVAVRMMTRCVALTGDLSPGQPDKDTT